MNSRSFLSQRPVVCLALSFGLGVWIGAFAGAVPLPFSLAGVTLSLVLIVARQRRRQSLAMGFCFLLLFLGAVRASAAMNPALPPEGRYHISATVEGLCELREEDGRVKAKLREIRMSDAAGTLYRAPAAYWSYYPKAAAPLPIDGQAVEMEASVYHPKGRQNPFGFNFRLYLLQKGIGIGISGARELSLSPSDQQEPASPWLRARLRISQKLDEAIGEGSELIRALLLGDRSGLSDETRHDFTDAGIAHVLSVSGLHVGLLMLGLQGLLKKMGLSARLRLLLVTAALIVYCRLLDFAPPVVRASVMGTVLLAADLAGERSDPLTGLAIAFLLILIAAPLQLFQVGFQLSFLAVLGILTLGDRLSDLYNRMWAHQKRIPTLDKAVYAVLATVSASAFTLPLVLNTFHAIPLSGLAASPLACAAVMWLMYYGLLIIPIAFLWMPLAKWLALPLGWLISLFEKATEAFASLPFSTLYAPAVQGVGAFLFVSALLFLTRYIRMKGWKQRAAACGLCLALLAGFVLRSHQADARFVRYTLLSAGNADAAVIEDGGNTYVIDAAAQGGDLAGYLLSKGKTVDVLFISHLHQDHIGGLKELIEQRVKIRKIVLPSGAEESLPGDGGAEALLLARQIGIPVEHWAKGSWLRKGRVRFDALWPEYGKIYPGMDANNHSLVLKVDLDGWVLLSGGDLTREYEMYSAVPAHVLKLAHHASKTSSSREYLQAVSPILALLSADQSRLPSGASSTLERLQRMEIPVWGTQEGRAVIMEVRPEGRLLIRHYGDRGI